MLEVGTSVMSNIAHAFAVQPRRAVRQTNPGVECRDNDEGCGLGTESEDVESEGGMDTESDDEGW